MNRSPESTPDATSRRDFLKHSGAAALAGGLAAQLGAARSAHASGNDTLRLGLVGCGGRGTGAAVQALTADRGAKLVAMADAFADRLAESHRNMKRKASVAERVEVPAERQFVGFDAYRQLIDSGVDVVLLAAPPHFRPRHLKAAIDAGKHVFAEKPVAVDAPGVRSVLQTCAEAKRKSLNVVSGLCWRYETGTIELMKRLHDGAVGDVLALEAHRHNNFTSKAFERPADWTDMQWQMRNWYYMTWLSGDFITEQFVHELDKTAWVMQDEYPVSCTCLGGRQTRVEPKYGHIYDHFSAVYEYAGGAKLFASTRQQPGCSSTNVVHVLGTRGTCDVKAYTIEGEDPWRWDGKRTVMHQLEHDAFFAALRKGDVINNGNYMAKSTMMAIMARMSAYTGKTITWEQAMNSKEDLSPARYDWDLPLPTPRVAMPGITPFV